MTANTGFEKQYRGKMLHSMLRVDIRRMFTSRLFYIMTAIALCIPIAILVMTSSVSGSGSAGSDAADTAAMESFESAWQIIGTEGGFSMTGSDTQAGETDVVSQPDEASDDADAADATMNMGMDMTSMCNINLVYFMMAVYICLFVGEDFRSGYAKNLFTVRAKKGDYVVSKTIIGIIAGAVMLTAFFVGTVLGGEIAGLSFELGSAGAFGLVCCMLAKILLTGVFAAIFLAMSVYAKKKTWLSICLSLGAGMLLFMMIPMMTPLNSSVMNIILCLAGSTMFGFGLGNVSKLILNKTSLV